MTAHAVQCLGAGAWAVVDGAPWTRPCADPDQLTHVFYAASIAPVGGATIKIWRPRRYVF